MDHVHTGATQTLHVVAVFVIVKVVGKTVGARYAVGDRWWNDLARAVLYVVD